MRRLPLSSLLPLFLLLRMIMALHTAAESTDALEPSGTDTDAEAWSLREEEESRMSPEDVLIMRTSLCMDYDSQSNKCEAVPKCTYLREEDVKGGMNGTASAAQTGGEPSHARCVVEPDYMKYLADSHCRMESKASILNTGRDLHREGIMPLPLLSHLRSRMDHALICRGVVFSYFSKVAPDDRILQTSWLDLKTWEKLVRVMR
mmetsp:Transcript_31727/g.78628  ORF Transcript_31727/g.78628 Transcript_31727/m.78628 type:complete len:204 (+) Transcript_31727:171-782(+)